MSITVTPTYAWHNTVQSPPSNFQPYVGISLLALCEQFLDPTWAFLLALCERFLDPIFGFKYLIWSLQKKGSLHSCWLVLKTFSLSLNCNWKYLKESQDPFLKFFWTLILTIQVSFSLDETRPCRRIFLSVRSKQCSTAAEKYWKHIGPEGRPMRYIVT